MKDYQEAAFSNWDARKQTMFMVFQRLLEAADKIDPTEAVSITNLVCDEMMAQCYYAEKLGRDKFSTDLLEKLFNKN